MKTTTTTLLVIGGGPGGYVAAIRAGQLGMPDDAGRRRPAGRHLPEHRLHPVQGADPRWPTQFEQARHYAGDSALGIRVETPAHRPGDRRVQWKDGIVGKLTGGVGALLKQERRAGGQGLGHASSTARPSRCRRRKASRCASSASTCCWPPARRRSNCRSCRSAGRVISSTEALALDRAAEARWWWSAPATSAWSWASPTASSAPRWRWSRRPDRVLPAYDEELTKPVLAALKQPGRHAAPGLHGARAWPTPATACACAARNADEFVLPADKVLVAVGPAAAHRRLRPRIAAAGHGRPRGQDRRPVPHLDAQRLGDRRPHRRADAGAPRDGAGRDGGRDHRRQEAPLHAGWRFPPCASPIRKLVVVGLTPARGRGQRASTCIGVAVPVRRQRPRDDAGGQRRLRARGRAPRQPPDPRLAGGGPGRVGAERRRSRSRSRWARGWKTWPAPSTRIRRWARRCRKRRCGRWGTRCTSDEPPAAKAGPPRCSCARRGDICPGRRRAVASRVQ